MSLRTLTISDPRNMAGLANQRSLCQGQGIYTMATPKFQERAYAETHAKSKAYALASAFTLDMARHRRHSGRPARCKIKA